MPRLFGTLVLALSFLVTGCGRKETPLPPPAKKDDAGVKREWLYGSRAESADIAWQSNGLGIRLLAPGEGTPPTSADRVRVHFKCVLKDGKVIDDSHARGGPVDLVVNR